MPVPAIHLMQRITRLQGPEQEAVINFTPAATAQPQGSIKTDKFIWGLEIIVKLRVAVGGTSFTPNYNALANLIQELRVRGTHVKFGQQTVLRVRGGSLWDYPSLFREGYTPAFYVNGVRGGTFAGTLNTNYDVEMHFIVPFPHQGPPLHEQVVWGALKGPDWPGDLHVEIDCGDGTSLGTTAANVTFSAYGGGGSGQIYVSLIRPVMTKDLAAAISPAIPFRTYKALDVILQGSNQVGQKLTDLNIGKKVARLIVKSGTQQTTTTSGILVYNSVSDSIITRAFPSLDGKGVKNPYSNLSTKEVEHFFLKSVPLKGYNVIDWIEGGNIQSYFPAEGLTAARRFELDGDVTGAANQIGEVIIEEMLGAPVLPRLSAS